MIYVPGIFGFGDKMEKVVLLLHFYMRFSILVNGYCPLALLIASEDGGKVIFLFLKYSF